MAHLMNADERFQVAAILGVIGRELRERGYPHAAQQDRLIDALLGHIEALEEAQVKQATDLVKALSNLSAAMRQWGRDIDNDDRREGYMACARDAATRIDELSTGPVMQAALDALDARVPE
jgi:hypothetical protein